MYVGWRSPAVFAYHGHPPCLDPSSPVGWALHTHSYWLRGTGLSPFPQKQLPKQMWREEMETFLSLVLSCSLSCAYACLCTYCSTRLEGSPVGVGQGETLVACYIFLSISLSLSLYFTFSYTHFLSAFAVCLCVRGQLHSAQIPLPVFMPLSYSPSFFPCSYAFSFGALSFLFPLSILFSDVVGNVGSLSSREQGLI